MSVFSETRIYAILNVLLRISTDNAEPKPILFNIDFGNETNLYNTQ